MSVISLTLGDKLPKLDLPMTGGKHFQNHDYKGKKLVIYFYPKDATPGCTTEGNEFTQYMEAFHQENCIVLGVSKDSLKKHENFKAKQQFAFDLISDADETLCQLFDVIRLKKLYGKEYLGIDRSTFIFDESHILVHEWRTVKVAGHVEEVLAYVQNMRK